MERAGENASIRRIRISISQRKEVGVFQLFVAYVHRKSALWKHGETASMQELMVRFAQQMLATIKRNQEKSSLMFSQQMFLTTVIVLLSTDLIQLHNRRSCRETGHD